VLELLAFAIRWRRIWLPVMITSVLIVGVYVFVVPPKYRSSAIIRGVESKGTSLGSILASKLSGLGNIAGFGSGFTEAQNEIYVLMLRTRSMAEAAIVKFNLREDLEMPDEPIEDVILAWQSYVYFLLEPQTNTISVNVDHEDPVKARDICEFYVHELDIRNQRTVSAQARKEREYAEKRLEEARAHLFALEDSMARFQRATGILNLEEQAKATVHAAAQIQAARLLAQAELEFKRSIFEADNPEAEILSAKIAGLESALGRFADKSEDPSERDFLLTLNQSTEEGKTYLRLYRDIEISQLLMAILVQQTEQARLEELKNTPTMSVVESPAVATKRVWPKRGMLVGLAGLGGLVFGLLAAAAIHFVRNVRKDELHPQHEGWKALTGSWKGNSG
jgi:uncharacterized protein involved in exopolysaccharide biosynthesis